jgi:hypothetical protein
MKILTKVIITTFKRAFTKEGGDLLPTTSPAGQWDMEAVLAWFVRGLLLIFLLWVAQNAGVDPATLLQGLGE